MSLTMRGIYTQIDGNFADALILARNSLCVVLNLLPNKVKVCEDPSLAMNELCIFCGSQVFYMVYHSLQGRQIKAWYLVNILKVLITCL